MSVCNTFPAYLDGVSASHLTLFREGDPSAYFFVSIGEGTLEAHRSLVNEKTMYFRREKATSWFKMNLDKGTHTQLEKVINTGLSQFPIHNANCGHTECSKHAKAHLALLRTLRDGLKLYAKNYFDTVKCFEITPKYEDFPQIGCVTTVPFSELKKHAQQKVEIIGGSIPSNFEAWLYEDTLFAGTPDGATTFAFSFKTKAEATAVRKRAETMIEEDGKEHPTCKHPECLSEWNEAMSMHYIISLCALNRENAF